MFHLVVIGIKTVKINVVSSNINGLLVLKTYKNLIFRHNIFYITIQRPLGRPRYGKRGDKKKHERSTCEKCTNINDLCLKMQAFNMSDSPKKMKKEKKTANEQQSN